MTLARTRPEQAAAQLADADPVDASVPLVDRRDFDAAAERLMRRVVEDEAHGRARVPRERGPFGLRRAGVSVRLACVGLMAVVAAGLFAVNDHESRPQIPAGEVIHRADDALAPRGGGSILYIAESRSSSQPGLHNSSFWAGWEQTAGDTCRARELNRESWIPGFSDGVEVQTQSGRQHVDQDSSYDSLTNTITRAPANRRAGSYDPFACASSDLPTTEIRQRLASGRASVVGRVTLNGIEAIEIRYTSEFGPTTSRTTYFARADGSYAPIKSITTTPVPRNCPVSPTTQARLRAWYDAHPSGGRLPVSLRPEYCGTRGVQTYTDTFHAYRELPASDIGVFDLRSVYPSAKVVTGTPSNVSGG